MRPQQYLRASDLMRTLRQPIVQNTATSAFWAARMVEEACMEALHHTNTTYAVRCTYDVALRTTCVFPDHRPMGGARIRDRRDCRRQDPPHASTPERHHAARGTAYYVQNACRYVMVMYVHLVGREGSCITIIRIKPVSAVSLFCFFLFFYFSFLASSSLCPQPLHFMASL